MNTNLPDEPIAMIRRALPAMAERAAARRREKEEAATEWREEQEKRARIAMENDKLVRAFHWAIKRSMSTALRQWRTTAIAMRGQ